MAPPPFPTYLCNDFLGQPRDDVGEDGIEWRQAEPRDEQRRLGLTEKIDFDKGDHLLFSHFDFFLTL